MKTRRMPRFALASCQALAVLALTACGGGGSDGGGSPGASTQHEVTVEQTGQSRSYNLYLPERANPSSSMPLVLLFHGAFGSPQTILASTDMKAKAEEASFAVATLRAKSPTGKRNGIWNAGYEGSRSGVNDVAFTEAVINKVTDDQRIDLDRVYAAGFSMGGAMVYRLACQLSDRITAVGVVSGYTSRTTQSLLPPGPSYGCSPNHPMPLLHIHGLGDQCVKYEGGRGEGFNETTNRTSVPAVVQRWTRRNSCSDQSRPDSDPSPGVDKRSNCAADSVVKLRTLKKQGHVWPGEAGYGLQGQCEGKQTGAVDATDRFWDFVKRFQLSALSRN